MGHNLRKPPNPSDGSASSHANARACRYVRTSPNLPPADASALKPPAARTIAARRALDSLFAPAQCMAVAPAVTSDRTWQPRVHPACVLRVSLDQQHSRTTQHLPALSRTATRKALPSRRHRPPDRREKEGEIPSPRLPGPAARQQHVKPRRVKPVGAFVVPSVHGTTRRRERRHHCLAVPPPHASLVRRAGSYLRHSPGLWRLNHQADSWPGTGHLPAAHGPSPVRGGRRATGHVGRRRYPPGPRAYVRGSRLAAVSGRAACRVRFQGAEPRSASLTPRPLAVPDPAPSPAALTGFALSGFRR